MKKPKIETKANEGTFIIDIKCRQNNTWQGTLNWVEKNETVPFRSMLEMIKLLDSALEGDGTEKITGAAGEAAGSTRETAGNTRETAGAEED